MFCVLLEIKNMNSIEREEAKVQELVWDSLKGA